MDLLHRILEGFFYALIIIFLAKEFRKEFLREWKRTKQKDLPIKESDYQRHYRLLNEWRTVYNNMTTAQRVGQLGKMVETEIQSHRVEMTKIEASTPCNNSRSSRGNYTRQINELLP